MLYDTKTNFKDEIKKLKNMSFKDKLWYIKEYYLVHIIIILIIVSIMSSILINILKKDPIFNAFFVNVVISEEERQDILEDFLKYSELEKTNDFWNLDTSTQIILDEKVSDPVANQQYLLKLTAILSSKKLDVMITQKELVDYFLTIDGFASLNDILPAEFLENNKENLYSAKNIDGVENIYAINVVNSPLFKKIGIKQDIYFTIAKNSENIETSLKFLEYIYKEPTN